VLLRDEATRNEAIKFFRSKHIGTTFHYLPLHLSPVGLGILGYKPGDFPVAESVSGRLLRLPIYPSLTEPEHTYIIETMKEFFKQ
jgi:dTDP-4-amino-4,6-dideoxygalactose transaminase